MATAQLLATWFSELRLRSPHMKSAPTFYRNLEEVLDIRRTNNTSFYTRSNEPAPNSIDFSSLDFLSLSSSGTLRTAFLSELSKTPDFNLGAGGSRLLNGNNQYIEAAEEQIAQFHGHESALIFHSGFEANVAVLTTIPRPGDAIIYDELVHASMHEGMQASRAAFKKSFKHNDLDSFRETLLEVKNLQPLIKQGSRCVLVCVESIYSMDGDVSPLEELLDIAKELFPDGNLQFFVDEAHTTGVLGHHGRGFVNELGLENKIAIRMHTFGKALACTGAAVVCNSTIRDTLINNARCFIYSTAPSFPMVAAIRSGYELMMSGQTQQLQDNVQYLVKHFFETIQAQPVWDEASFEGILSIPLLDDWESRPFQSQIVPVSTRPRYTLFLCYHIQLAGINAFPIDYPVVPKGSARLRVVFHAGNTVSEVEKLIDALCEWAQEMMDIEADDGGAKANIPRAARQVAACQANMGAPDSRDANDGATKT